MSKSEAVIVGVADVPLKEGKVLAPVLGDSYGAAASPASSTAPGSGRPSRAARVAVWRILNWTLVRVCGAQRYD